MDQELDRSATRNVAVPAIRLEWNLVGTERVRDLGHQPKTAVLSCYPRGKRQRMIPGSRVEGHSKSLRSVDAPVLLGKPCFRLKRLKAKIDCPPNCSRSMLHSCWYGETLPSSQSKCPPVRKFDLQAPFHHQKQLIGRRMDVPWILSFHHRKSKALIVAATEDLVGINASRSRCFKSQIDHL